MELTKLTITEIQRALKKKEFSALELTQSYLKKIEEIDGEIGAFLTVAKKEALARAKEIDELIEKEEKMPLLAGVPCAIKDNLLVKGLRCTAGSKILKNYTAVYDATCVERLKKEGAVVLGKTNMDEFAMGSSTEYSAFQTTKNPKDTSRVPGGSSGGSAAAVAAEEACFALGSDTGGSVRQPASFCGVVGLKPTYGAVSRYGLIAFASSLDQVGPLARTVEDAEIVFNVIAGKDEKDSTSVELKRVLSEKRQESIDLRNLKIGLPKECFGEGVEKEVKEAIEKILRMLEEEGAEIKEISLPHTKYATACYYLIAPSEASSNLARYDGIRYGMSYLAQAQQGVSLTLKQAYLKVRQEGFGEEVKRRIMLGTYALSAGYYDAYYLKAQKVRTKILQDFKRAFEEIDLILIPTSPTLPFKIGEKLQDPLQMYLSDVFTNSVNLAGLPALSLPVGEVQGLPVGLQIIGKEFGEKDIFEAGKFIEKLASF
jgi:aspartyl-tRNA(Asn)/glutamyl-tRNA(Gln) amidotransferase subunit A